MSGPKFHIAAFRPNGHFVDRSKVTADQVRKWPLAESMLEVFSENFRKSPNGFAVELRFPNLPDLRFRWFSPAERESEDMGYVGLASLMLGDDLTAVGAFLPGLDSVHEEAGLQLLQIDWINAAFQNAGIEPGFNLRAITERPLVSFVMADMVTNSRAPPDVAAIFTGMACLAVSYFGMLGLIE